MKVKLFLLRKALAGRKWFVNSDLTRSSGMMRPFKILSVDVTLNRKLCLNDAHIEFFDRRVVCSFDAHRNDFPRFQWIDHIVNPQT
jgi:hypothetical protein